MSYDPRIYWKERAKREGQAYVAYKNRKQAFSQQLDVFSAEMEHFLPRGGKVLDFGCGVGRFAPFVSKHADWYEGVDITKEALNYAPPLKNGNFTYLNQDKLPFPAEHFDGVLAITVLQHIVDTEAFALWTSELNRVVKEGGYFFIIDTPEPPKKVKRGFHMMWRTPEDIAFFLDASLQASRQVSAEFENSHYSLFARKSHAV